MEGKRLGFDAMPEGLSRAVQWITGEPQGANRTFDNPVSVEFLQTSENFGPAILRLQA